ncbi:acyltransferase family protein [Hyphomicrobium sp. LHD-15]|uniref:acyltransferase family protein n=1 Tax=Hyphomicrobium sp. LHD-15 TaxID=3072142 RepID=UPI00280D57A5|nr:acyltransferase family protein [Hyphomicrobium sp. LHD-15]MDQ8699854.1 acyltransferase family protein [Hyphomicrobium sp. LHD-15]
MVGSAEGYRPEIDGLRAIAVLSVIFFHAGIPGFSGGYVGVDVFFVISGYLICSIVVGELRSDTFSFAKFYERRARRILPALFVMLLASAAVAPLVLLPNDMLDFSRSLTHVIPFLSNTYFYDQRGYFETAAELKPLIHTWSLAVEEQFYVVLPIAAWALWRWHKSFLLPALVIAAAASLAYSQYSVSADPHAAFYLTTSRAWELLAGAILAVFTKQRNLPAQPSQAGGAAGLMLIVFAVFFFDQTVAFPGLNAVVPVAGALLVLHYGAPQTAVGQLLGSKLAVGIGLISYSAYLWHQPLFAFARHLTLTEPGLPIFAVLIAATLALAFLSWRYVEQPFRRGTIDRRGIVAVAVAASVFLFSVGMAGTVSDGYARLYQASWDSRQLAIWNEGKNAVPRDNGDCHLSFRTVSAELEPRFDACLEKYGKAIVVLGDSHAADVFGAIASQSDRKFILGVAQGGCRPHSPADKCHYDGFLSFLERRSQAISDVIYVQAGFHMIQDDDGHPGDRSFFRKRAIPVYRPDIDAIDQTIRYLNTLSTRARVTWLGPRFEPHVNTMKIKKFAMACEDAQIEIHDSVSRTWQALDAFLTTRLAEEPRLRYVSGLAAVPFDSRHDLYDCHSVYWEDTDHWSASGERRFGKRIVAALQASAQ